MMSFAVGATESHFSRSDYTGKERDTESGLDDFGARYYASDLTPWIRPFRNTIWTYKRVPEQ